MKRSLAGIIVILLLGALVVPGVAQEEPQAVVQTLEVVVNTPENGHCYGLTCDGTDGCWKQESSSDGKFIVELPGSFVAVEMKIKAAVCSEPITQNGCNDCYCWEGLGTNRVTIWKIGSGPTCQDISHVEVLGRDPTGVDVSAPQAEWGGNNVIVSWDVSPHATLLDGSFVVRRGESSDGPWPDEICTIEAKPNSFRYECVDEDASEQTHYYQLEYQHDGRVEIIGTATVPSYTSSAYLPIVRQKIKIDVKPPPLP